MPVCSNKLKSALLVVDIKVGHFHFQCKAKCEAIDKKIIFIFMQIIFIFMQIKLIFTTKILHVAPPF